MMRKTSRNHQTQWAAQFAVASELCKRDYEVSFTLGHSAPIADIIAISPQARATVLVDVKGLFRQNPWLVKRKPARQGLFYVLAYVATDSSNRFFIFDQLEMNRMLDAELKRLGRGAGYPVTGILWSLALPAENAWDKLPR